MAGRSDIVTHGNWQDFLVSPALRFGFLAMSPTSLMMIAISSKLRILAPRKVAIGARRHR
jgi:hypothetical protein